MALFIYFHIYLQRLWEVLATLPAIFPDGRRLDERSHPWLLGDLVRRYLPRLRRQRLALSRLQSGVSILLMSPIQLGIVGWVERSKTNRDHDASRFDHDGFRFAQPILQLSLSPTPERRLQLLGEIF